jgi:hypothetical protein
MGRSIYNFIIKEMETLTFYFLQEKQEKKPLKKKCGEHYGKKALQTKIVTFQKYDLGNLRNRARRGDTIPLKELLRQWQATAEHIEWSLYAYNCIKGVTQDGGKIFMFLVEKMDECSVIIEIKNVSGSINEKIYRDFATVEDAEAYMQKQKEIMELRITLGVI